MDARPTYLVNETALHFLHVVHGELVERFGGCFGEWRQRRARPIVSAEAAADDRLRNSLAAAAAGQARDAVDLNCKRLRVEGKAAMKTVLRVERGREVAHRGRSESDGRQ